MDHCKQRERPSGVKSTWSNLCAKRREAIESEGAKKSCVMGLVERL